MNIYESNNLDKLRNVKQFIVKAADLPLACSGNFPNQQLYDSHPKVYLPIKQKKIIDCPYCATRYVLVE